MTTVYLVSTGSYSDYTICGAFSTEEKALAFINGDGDYVLEPWELDAESAKQVMPVYVCRLFLDTGGIKQESSFTGVRDVARRDCEIQYETYKRFDWPSTSDATGPGVMVQSPVSPEHARKVAVETRQEWLRTGCPAAVGG